MTERQSSTTKDQNVTQIVPTQHQKDTVGGPPPTESETTEKDSTETESSGEPPVVDHEARTKVADETGSQGTGSEGRKRRRRRSDLDDEDFFDQPKDEGAAVESGTRRKVKFPEKPSFDKERAREQNFCKISAAPKRRSEKRIRTDRTSKNSVDPKTWLRETYTNCSGEMGCQICELEMPFNGRDGKPHFEAVEIWDDSIADIEMEEFFLALCPVCAAKYQEFVKHEPDKRTMRKVAKTVLESDLESEEYRVTLRMGLEHASIRFVESHFGFLKQFLDELYSESTS